MSVGADEAAEVRDLATRGTPLGARIDGLRAAVDAARGHIPDPQLDEALASADRAAGRMRLSAQHTVVAIAGATGSGKSSTFNHLVGLELSSIGVRRPTTSWATAVVWGSDGAGELLQWLGIPPRHHTMRDSLLDTRREDSALNGIVLMDLPDHDSTEVAHHLEVDRLVELADLLVWVVDPQKYADAALHDRYLKPLATHQGVMVVVLNHIDTIAEEKRAGMIADVRRLLAADGLGEVTVLAVSAREGIGMDDLRAELASRVASKRATTARAEADIAAAAQRLEQVGGTGPVRELDTGRVDELEESTAAAAGVPAVVEGVERYVADHTGRAVAWPPVALLARASRGSLERELGGSGAPEVAPVPREAVNTIVRGLGDEVGEGLGPSWRRSVQSAVTGRLPDLGDRLDKGLRSVDLRLHIPGWAGLLRVVQWLLLLVAVVGGVWWIYLAATGKASGAPSVAGLPVAAVMLLVGLVLGIVLWLVGRALVHPAARARAAAADSDLRKVVRSALDDAVVTPANAELRGYAEFRSGIAAATR